MAEYSIKEVETLSGVKAHTLRIWEQRYDFLKPHRSQTNIRYYTDEQLRMLLNIGTLNRSGMKISHIAALSKDEIGKEVNKLVESSAQPDTFLDSMVQAMIDFDEQRFERTLTDCILKLGFQQTFEDVVFPFMIRTGVMWATGAAGIAQEHFISNLIRRKLMVAIDREYSAPAKDAKRYLLFLREGENHELLLLFSEYLLRKEKQEVVFLGASLPFQELTAMVTYLKPDVLVSYFTISLRGETLKDYLNKLLSNFKTQNIIVGGTRVLEEDIPKISRLQVVDSVGVLQKCLINL